MAERMNFENTQPYGTVRPAEMRAATTMHFIDNFFDDKLEKTEPLIRTQRPKLFAQIMQRIAPKGRRSPAWIQNALTVGALALAATTAITIGAEVSKHESTPAAPAVAVKPHAPKPAPPVRVAMPAAPVESAPAEVVPIVPHTDTHHGKKIRHHHDIDALKQRIHMHGPEPENRPPHFEKVDAELEKIRDIIAADRQAKLPKLTKPKVPPALTERL